MQQTNAIVQPPLFYTSITKLPLSVFIEALVDGNLSALVISGTPTKEEIQAVWEDILLQYSEAIGGVKQTANLKLYREIRRLQIKLQSVILLVGVLKECSVEKFAKALNSLLNTNFKLDITNLEQYDKELHKCMVRSRQFEVQIQIKAAELQALHKSDQKGEDTKPDRQYFQTLLIYLSDHAKYQLSEQSLTVFMFCERLKQYNKHMEQLAKQGNKK